MSKIQIAASGSQGWRDHKRRKALSSVVRSFIKEEAERAGGVVCVDTKYSNVILTRDVTRDATTRGVPSVRDVPDVTLKLIHGCEVTASHYFHRRFVVVERRTTDDAGRRLYEQQDLSVWLPDEYDSDEEEESYCIGKATSICPWSAHLSAYLEGGK